MFAIFGICGLLFFILARPQEYFEILQKLPLLYLFCAGAVGGFVLDIKLRLLEPRPTPILRLVLAFMLWTTVSNVMNAPQLLMKQTIELAILFVLFSTIAHGVQRLRTLRVVALVLMSTCMIFVMVGIDQGLNERSCIVTVGEMGGEGYPDGRFCEIADDCYGYDSEPGAEYRCEKAGMFGTFSVEDRVRYRGELQDPNELGLAICIGAFAFLIAFANQRRNLGTIAIAIAGSILVFWCVMLTQSRGAVLVFALVGGVYFARRYGIGGVVAAAGFALPLTMLGGRSGDKADASTQLRYEAWGAGLQMWKKSPIWGVGARQFAEHHHMTAHNSYVLSLAELGIVGMVLFIAMLVLTLKTLIRGIMILDGVPGARPAQAWAMAILSSFCGMLFSINTLSFCYHSLMWIFLGLGGAWVSVVRTHKPDFDIRLTRRDYMIITGCCLFYAIVVLPIYLRSKGV